MDVYNSYCARISEFYLDLDNMRLCMIYHMCFLLLTVFLTMLSNNYIFYFANAVLR